MDTYPARQIDVVIANNKIIWEIMIVNKYSTWIIIITQNYKIRGFVNHNILFVGVAVVIVAKLYPVYNVDVNDDIDCRDKCYSTAAYPIFPYRLSLIATMFGGPACKLDSCRSIAALLAKID